MEPFFFNGWESLARILVMGLLAYATLIVFLRMSGNRTLSKMNAFDLIVTVALGSTLATVLLSKDIALADAGVGAVNCSSIYHYLDQCPFSLGAPISNR